MAATKTAMVRGAGTTTAGIPYRVTLATAFGVASGTQMEVAFFASRKATPQTTSWTNPRTTPGTPWSGLRT